MSGETRWGASPEDWTTLSVLAGLTADLQPVVSNIHAEIAPGSKMTDLGKTPSVYNRDGNVVGIVGWTRLKATPAEVRRWSSEGDYGICVQTRWWRAIDIDIGDVETANAVETAVQGFLRERELSEAPVRFRSNSAKRLLPVAVTGELRKRTWKCKEGIIELLGNGQQFIAAGTHPSGSRYTWRGGTPDFAPVLTAEQLDELWALLGRQFAVSPEEMQEDTRYEGELAVRKASDIQDPYIAAMEAIDIIVSWTVDGRANITCPWASEHTTENETSTQYFPAGVGGLVQGHFKCLHSHCVGRTDADFLDAFGLRVGDFDLIPAAGATDGAPPVDPRVGDSTGEYELPKGLRRSKDGVLLPILPNLSRVLPIANYTGARLALDVFREEIVCAPPGTTAWRPWTDVDYVALRSDLERRGWGSIGKELMRDAVALVASSNQFDSGIAWGRSLAWDGIPRVDTFVSRYWGAENTPYHREVGRYLWTAMAGRLLTPGCKADMVPIMVGEQGLGKSTAVQSMVPAPSMFAELDLSRKDDDIARQLRGCLVAEMAELQGLGRRELMSTKAFVTRTHEKWVPKWQEFATTYPRRCVFIGTTNREDFLEDTTGNRRWLPVRVTRGLDAEGIARDRDQLWAEAVAMYLVRGVLFGGAQDRARAQHGEFTANDVWEDALQRWLHEEQLDGSTPLEEGDGSFTLIDIAVGALGLMVSQLNRPVEMRLGDALRRLGYEKYRVMRKGERVVRWRKTPA